jgi:formylglycine-generating enzyme required for sulfatase activity
MGEFFMMRIRAIFFLILTLVFSLNADLPLSQVAAGKVIIGDPFNDNIANELSAWTADINAFEIGTYEVTNAEYVTWLNQAYKNGSILYSQSGYVSDKQGNILCKTDKKGIPSGISFKEGIFVPVKGLEKHPVIFVSWYGANFYCIQNGYYLPTEAQWEKAAGMKITKEDETLKKYRYGFSQDEIDPSWANYKSPNDSPKKGVPTTEVGFYNGKNTLSNSLQAKLAVSPVGAFDMSGNVWEWVSDWYMDSKPSKPVTSNPKGPLTGSKKVTKGGCYDSFAEGVRVAERMGLYPNHTDAFTGFRVAKDRD